MTLAKRRRDQHDLIHSFLLDVRESPAGGGSDAGAEPGCPQCRGGGAPSAEGAARPACPGSGLLPTAGMTPSPLATTPDPESEFARPQGHTGFLGRVCGNLSPIRKRFWTEKPAPGIYTENLCLKETNAHVRAHSSRSPSMEGVRSRWKAQRLGACLAKNGATQPTATLQGVRTRNNDCFILRQNKGQKEQHSLLFRR